MNTAIKKAISLAVCAGLIVTSPANAGFMDDFFNSAGAMSNVTDAQAYGTASSDVLSGGSLVFRAPQRAFTPFSFTPPSLKAGCGGIDMFMGAFGMANKQEFVQFLRNVGQNSAGLAFKVALQAMSPDLATQVQEIADTINEWNKYFGSSCEAAKRVMDSGPNAWISETVRNAKRNLVATGAASGETEAGDMVDTNGDAAIANAPSRQNAAGKTIEAAELNIVWAAMNRGTLAGLTDAEKEMMMSMIGTTVLRKQGSGDSATIEPEYREPKFKISSLVGNPTDSVGTLNVYACDDADKCMNPSVNPQQMQTFGQLFYSKSKGLRDAILTRSAPNLADLKLLSVATSLPLIKIIELSASVNRGFLGDEMLQVWSVAAAWEIASHYVEDVAGNLEKMLRSSRDSDNSAKRAEAVQKVLDDLARIKLEMRSERAQIYDRIQKAGAMIGQLEHLERAMYGGLSANLAANVRFGR